MIAQFTEELPELAAFVAEVAEEYKAGQFDNWPSLIKRIRPFYTPQMMNKIEAVAPGWRHMASFADQQTLIHVTTVLMCLYLHDDFQTMTPAQQNLLWWSVMFHDIGKEADRDYRDYIHGFISTAIASQALTQLDANASPDAGALRKWDTFTRASITQKPGLDDPIQDNSRLPTIIKGITDLFGDDTPSALVLKAVLFHMSITVAPAWPQKAPLTDAEIKQYITPKLYPLLRVLMIVDGQSWALFEPERKADETATTLRVFDHVATLIGMQWA